MFSWFPCHATSHSPFPQLHVLPCNIHLFNHVAYSMPLEIFQDPFVFHHLRFLAVALSFITDSTLTDDNYCAIASAVVSLLQDILRSCGKDGCLPETTSCLDQHVDHFAVCHVILWFYALFSSHWFVGTHWCNWIKTTSIDGGGPWSYLGEWEWGWGWWVATSGRLNVVCNAFYSFTSYWCFGNVSKLLQIDYNTQNDNGFGQTT